MNKINMTDILDRQAKLIELLVLTGKQEVHMDDIGEITTACITCGIEINIIPINRFEALVHVIEKNRMAV